MLARAGWRKPSIGKSHPAHRFSLYAPGQVEAHAAVAEVDEDPVEQFHRVHTEQDRRPVLHVECGERIIVGKGNGQVVDGEAAYFDLAQLGIFAVEDRSGDASLSAK